MGTRHSFNLICVKHWDHPHAYGDKYKNCLIPVIFQGSSPRVWGQVTAEIYRGIKQRIIPTRMGTSERRRKQIRCQGDHPHAYGDKYHQKRSESLQRGSSPRVWGQVLSYTEVAVMMRIIPTRMGTSCSYNRRFIYC